MDRPELGRERERRAGVNAAAGAAGGHQVIDGGIPPDHRGAEPRGEHREAPAVARPQPRAAAAERIPGNAEPRRELVREPQRGAEPHQLPAQAGVDRQPGARRERILGVRRGIHRAVGQLGARRVGAGLGRVLAARAAREPAARQLAGRRRAVERTAGEPRGRDQPAVLERRAGPQHVRAELLGHVAGDRRPIAGHIGELARAAARERRGPDRAIRDARREILWRAVGADRREPRIIGEHAGDVRAAQLWQVGGGTIVRGLGARAAVPGELHARAGLGPARVPGRGQIAGGGQAIDAGGLRGREREEPAVARHVADQRELDVVGAAVEPGAGHDRHVVIERPVGRGLERDDGEIAGWPVGDAVAVVVDPAQRAPRPLGRRQGRRDPGGIPRVAAAQRGERTGRDQRRRGGRPGVRGRAPHGVGPALGRRGAAVARPRGPDVGGDLVRGRPAPEPRVDHATGARAVARREPAGGDQQAIEKRERDAGLGGAGLEAVGGRAVDRPAVLEPGRAAQDRAELVVAGAQRIARDRLVRGVTDRQAQQVAGGQPGRQRVWGGGVERIACPPAVEREAIVAARQRAVGRPLAEAKLTAQVVGPGVRRAGKPSGYEPRQDRPASAHAVP